MWMSPEDNSVLLAIAVPYDGEKVSQMEMELMKEWHWIPKKK